MHESENIASNLFTEYSDIIGFSLSSIYEWLNRFAVDGYEGLKTRKAPGAPPIITREMDDWLKTTVLGSTPEDFGYETPLWTSDILAELLQQEFGVTAASRTVNQHLKNLVVPSSIGFKKSLTLNLDQYLASHYSDG